MSASSSSSIVCSTKKSFFLSKILEIDLFFRHDFGENLAKKYFKIGRQIEF
jgi:hypothetical protein